MNEIPAPHRGPACPPAVVLEGLSAGEPAEATVTAHVDGCADCRGYVEALKAEQQVYLKARPPEMFLRKLERREAEKPRGFRWMRWVLAALPLAAIALLMVRPGDDVRLKGAGGLRVAALAKGASEPRMLEQDSRIAAGDSLRFRYEAPQDGQLLVLDRDGTGAASVFWPFGATASSAVAKGHDGFLDGTVELDAAPGPEWIVAVFAPHPLDAAPLLAQLRATEPGTAPTVTCDDCTVQTLRLLKGP